MLNDKMYYTDEFMYFTFNTIRSEQFNLSIQNDIDDLKLYINSGASIDYTAPKYQNGQYVLGVTHSQREFPLKVVARGLNRGDIRQMAQWLKVGSIGVLSFDFATDWGYDTILDTLSDFNLYPMDDEEHFIVSFDLTFKTVEGISAHTISSAHWDSTSNYQLGTINNLLNIPTIEQDDNSFYIYFLGDDRAEIDFTCTYPSDLQNIDIQIAVPDENYLTHFKAVLRGSTNKEKTDTNNLHTLTYKGHSNLLFAEDMLPEYARIHGHFENNGFVLQYNNEPMRLKSPGAPQRINDIGDIEYLRGTPNWFVCSPAVVKRRQYNEGPYGRDLYPIQILKKADITRYNIEEDNWDSIYQDYKDKTELYCGFYATIEIIDESEVEKDLIFSVKQYTEVI